MASTVAPAYPRSRKTRRAPASTNARFRSPCWARDILAMTQTNTVGIRMSTVFQWHPTLPRQDGDVDAHGVGVLQPGPGVQHDDSLVLLDPTALPELARCRHAGCTLG